MGASRIGKHPIFAIQRIPAPYLCQYPYLFRMTESIKIEWNNASTSPMPIDSQMPSTFKIKGNVNTATVGKRKVRTVDKNKEIAPFDNAVKKEET